MKKKVHEIIFMHIDTLYYNKIIKHIFIKIQLTQIQSNNLVPTCFIVRLGYVKHVQLIVSKMLIKYHFP